VAVSVAAIEIH